MHLLTESRKSKVYPRGAFISVGDCTPTEKTCYYSLLAEAGVFSTEIKNTVTGQQISGGIFSWERENFLTIIGEDKLKNLSFVPESRPGGKLYGGNSSRICRLFEV